MPFCRKFHRGHMPQLGDYMITSRRITETDRASIEQALARDFFHPGTPSNVFFEPGTVTNIYEEDHQPVLLVKVYKCLHLDLLCYDNADTVRNKHVLQAGWIKLIADAKANGFKEIVTSVNGPEIG